MNVKFGECLSRDVLLYAVGARDQGAEHLAQENDGTAGTCFGALLYMKVNAHLYEEALSSAFLVVRAGDQGEQSLARGIGGESPAPSGALHLFHVDACGACGRMR